MGVINEKTEIILPLGVEGDRRSHLYPLPLPHPPLPSVSSPFHTSLLYSMPYQISTLPYALSMGITDPLYRVDITCNEQVKTYRIAIALTIRRDIVSILLICTASVQHYAIILNMAAYRVFYSVYDASYTYQDKNPLAGA